MLAKITNASKALRGVRNIGGSLVMIAQGETKEINISDVTLKLLQRKKGIYDIAFDAEEEQDSSQLIKDAKKSQAVHSRKDKKRKYRS